MLLCFTDWFPCVLSACARRAARVRRLRQGAAAAPAARPPLIHSYPGSPWAQSNQNTPDLHAVRSWQARCSLGLALDLGEAVRVAVQGDFKLAEGGRLHLACVLQLADPLGLLLFEAGDLGLNLNSLFIFLVNSPDQVQALLLPLEGVFLLAQVPLLLLLVADHVLHRLRLDLLALLLQVDELLVLLALALQLVGFASVSLGLLLIVELDGLLLVLAVLSVTLHAIAVLGLLLRTDQVLLLAVLRVALPHLHDVDRLFLSLLDFLPSLHKDS